MEGRAGDGRKREVAGYRDALDGGKDDDAQDVVDDGRPQDDLRLGQAEFSHIGQNPRRDPDAGRGQGRAYEHGLHAPEAQHRHQAVTQGEGDGDAHSGHGQGGGPRLEELGKVAVDSGFK